MEALIVVAFCLSIPLSFVYYPSAFLAGLLILLLWLYLVNEHLFHPRLVDLARTASTVRDKLPYRDEFLTNTLRSVLAWVEDDCIICRDQPTSPVRTPCGHIFCKDCFMDWIDRDHQRCPYCTRKLFHSSSRAFEKTIKLTIVSMAVGVFSAVINLISGHGGRVWVVLTTLATAMQFTSVRNAWKYRGRYGTLWWKHSFTSPDNVHGPNENVELDVAGLFCFCTVAWAIYQATILGKRLTEYFLLKVLFGW